MNVNGRSVVFASPTNPPRLPAQALRLKLDRGDQVFGQDLWWIF